MLTTAALGGGGAQLSREDDTVAGTPVPGAHGRGRHLKWRNQRGRLGGWVHPSSEERS